MHVILATFGTAGDTLPMIALARHLQQAGHEVDLLGLHYFSGAARSAGVNFHPVGPPGLFEEFSRDPLAWHPYKGFGALWQRIARAIPDTVAHIDRLRQEAIAAVAFGDHALFGATVCRESHNRHVGQDRSSDLQDDRIPAHIGQVDVGQNQSKFRAARQVVSHV